MNAPNDFSNLLITDGGTLVFLGDNGYEVIGVKEYKEKLFFKLRQ